MIRETATPVHQNLSGNVNFFYFFYHFRDTVCEAIQLPKDVVYASQLHRSKAYHQINKTTFAVAQCNDQGQITKKFHVIEYVQLGQNESVFLCSCSSDQHTALLKGDVIPICCHAVEAANIWPIVVQNDDDNDDDDPQGLIQLTDSLYAVRTASGFAIVSQTKAAVKCVSCATKVTTCVHVKEYRQQLAALGNVFNANLLLILHTHIEAIHVLTYCFSIFSVY